MIRFSFKTKLSRQELEVIWNMVSLVNSLDPTEIRHYMLIETCQGIQKRIENRQLKPQNNTLKLNATETSTLMYLFTMNKKIQGPYEENLHLRLNGELHRTLISKVFTNT